MPAFTFEKIPPPGRRDQITSIVKKPRGVIVQMLDRFVKARLKRSIVEEEGAAIRPAPKASE